MNSAAGAGGNGAAAGRKSLNERMAAYSAAALPLSRTRSRGKRIVAVVPTPT
jgi:hypothetical protein